MKTTTEAKLIELKAAYEANGPSALIDGCCGSNHAWGSRLWSAAMTEKYGPTGLHKDWTAEDGSPSAACLETFPNVAYRIAAARESIAGVWSFIGGTHPWLAGVWS
jgi:hypothetical protein